MEELRKLFRGVSLLVLVCGLIVTALIDYVLLREDQQVTREFFTPYAVHRLEGVENIARWYSVFTQSMALRIQENPEDYRNSMDAPRIFMSVNPSVHSILVIPEEGAPVSISDESGMEDGRVLKNGGIKGAADIVKTTGRTVFLDSLNLGTPYPCMVFIRPVYAGPSQDQVFWGYIVVIANQNAVLERANISNLGKQNLYYNLEHRYAWESDFHVVEATAAAYAGDPSNTQTIAGDEWRITLRPYGGGHNRQSIFFATLCGILASIFVASLWRKNRRLAVMGATDALTGVYNRKGGDAKVAEYLAGHGAVRAMVIALDIDNFKLINDVYGHKAGDDALKQLCRDMEETFGKETIITRNGGDEFILFHPYTNIGEVLTKLDHFSSHPHRITAAGKEVKFFTSLGCAAYPQQGDSYGKLCIRADFALYGAKLNGKASWRQYDHDMGEVHRRTQFGFNLSEVANRMPGGMMVCQADEKEEILFANKVMIEMLDCKDFDEFTQYIQGSLYNVIYPEDREAMKQEFTRQLGEKDNEEQVDFLTFRMVTKTGRIITVDDMARKCSNPFYGELYYIFVYDRSKKEKVIREKGTEGK